MIFSFGLHWQRELWHSPYRLRFELADGEHVGQSVARFITSFDRARLLARQALPSEEVASIIGSVPDPNAASNADWLGWTSGSGFGLLAELGVSTESAFAEWEGYWWPDDVDDPEVQPWPHRAVRLNWEQADILLWNQIAQDLGVAPRAPVLAKLLDPAAGICVNAYDDRGMDVTCLSQAPLLGLYAEYSDWLLDSDRDRISLAFGDPANGG